MLTALEVNGPPGAPSAPAGSNVSVRVVAATHRHPLSVPADWYFRATTPGQAPQQVASRARVLRCRRDVQATAAQLAEAPAASSSSPPSPSNPFAAEPGSTGAESVGGGGPVRGNRAATDSQCGAGYASWHGLAADAELPRTFALAGHSAGGSPGHRGRRSPTWTRSTIWRACCCSTPSPPVTPCDAGHAGRNRPLHPGPRDRLALQPVELPQQRDTALSTGRAPAHFTGSSWPALTPIRSRAAVNDQRRDGRAGRRVAPAERAGAGGSGRRLAVQWFAGVTDADDDLVPGFHLHHQHRRGPRHRHGDRNPARRGRGRPPRTVALAVLAFLPARVGTCC